MLLMRSFEECKVLLGDDRNYYNYLAQKTQAWLALMDSTASWSSSSSIYTTAASVPRARYWHEVSMCSTVGKFVPLWYLGLSSKELLTMAALDSALSMLIAMQSQHQEDTYYPNIEVPPAASSNNQSSCSQALPQQDNNIIMTAASHTPYHVYRYPFGTTGNNKYRHQQALA